MKQSFETGYLFIAGLVMLLVGTYIAIMTDDYMGAISPQNTLASVDLLSDIRGMGGMLFALGLYVFVSTFRKAWRQSGLIIAIIVYASFVCFRSLGLVLDGLPSMSIILACAIEVVLAVTGFFVARRKGV